jgi:hypothetical protein
MDYLLQVCFDNSRRLSRRSYLFEFKGTQFKLLQNDPRKWADQLQRPNLYSYRLTGVLLDRLTHHVHILELNGDSAKRYTTVVGQWRRVVVGTEPITDAIPSVSIVFNASASAVSSVGKDSFQTVEFPNSSTTSSIQPAFPSS